MRIKKSGLFLFITIISLTLLLTACGESAGDIDSETQTEQITVDVFGQLIPEDASEISLNAADIKSFDALLSSLKQLNGLKTIDLNDFELSVDEKQQLTNAFPEAEIKCKTYIILSGEKVYTDASELSLSSIDAEELKNALSALPSVTRVSSEEAIALDNKDALRAEFPNVDFDIPGQIEIYGITVRDDAEELDLSGANIEYGAFSEQLKRLPLLKKVSLYGTEISEDDQAALFSGFPDIRFSWDVDILGQKYDSETEDLDLSGNKKLTVDTVRQKLPLMRGVTRIDLSDINATNEELAALREEFPDVKVVWKLYMGKWSLKTDAVAFSVLIYHYDYTRLTSKDIEVLKYCTDLQALDLGHQSISDISVIGEYLKDLRILILADNRLNDLTPVSNLKHLHYIELFVNRPLTDVSPLGECKELVDINISHLYSIKDISALLDFPQLERLWIEHTAVSAKDINLLKETYPNTKIVVEGYGSVDQGWRTHPRYKAMIDMFNKTDYISEEFSKYDR